MAYSFQTYTVGQVLTAANMNQEEVNIRDHVHGAAGVTGTTRTMSPETSSLYDLGTPALLYQNIWSVTGPGGFYRFDSTANCVGASATAETTCYSFALPTGVPGATKGLFIDILPTVVFSIGVGNPSAVVMRAKYGANTFMTMSMSPPTGATANSGQFFMSFYLTADQTSLQSILPVAMRQRYPILTTVDGIQVNSGYYSPYVLNRSGDPFAATTVSVVMSHLMITDIATQEPLSITYTWTPSLGTGYANAAVRIARV